MDICDRRGLKGSAREALLGAAYDPKRLILIHTGAMAVLSLILAVLNFVLEKGIGGTGGLSGIGTRSILTTAQSVLQLAQVIILPFWQIGWLFVTIKLSRKEQAAPEDLLEGFRRFFPVLRLYLLQGALYMGIAMLCSYVASIIFMMTPWAAPFMDVVMQYMEATDTAAMEAALEQVTADAVLPLMGIMAVVFVVFAAPYFYRFRMAQFVILDNPKPGALAALRESRKMMRGNAVSLFKLDLSFWWFYGLELLIVALAYLDALLPLLGVTLPWSSAVTYFVLMVLYSGCQMLLYWCCKPQVDVTYAKVYEALSQPGEEQTLLPDQSWGE